jgi:hypothetical protein
MKQKKSGQEDLLKSDGTGEQKEQLTTPMTVQPENEGRMKEIAAKMAELKDITKNKGEIQEHPDIKLKPKIKIKETDSRLLEKKDLKMKVTEEQLNTLTFAACSGICIAMDKEDMNIDDTKNFSSVLYEIGVQQGWWEKVEFLPYLILIGASVELGLKIYKKPSKHPHKVVQQVIEEKIERKEQPLTNAEIGKVDLIDQDKLIEKLGGNKLYKASGEVYE